MATTNRLQNWATSTTSWGFPLLYLGWAYLFWVPIFGLETSVWEGGDDRPALSGRRCEPTAGRPHDGLSHGWRRALRIALGIGIASVVFGLLHAPGALLADATIVDVLGFVGLRALTGVFFGSFYELTRNVYFVALRHRLGNTWPLIIDWNAWSGTVLGVFSSDSPSSTSG